MFSTQTMPTLLACVVLWLHDFYQREYVLNLINIYKELPQITDIGQKPTKPAPFSIKANKHWTRYGNEARTNSVNI